MGAKAQDIMEHVRRQGHKIPRSIDISPYCGTINFGQHHEVVRTPWRSGAVPFSAFSVKNEQAMCKTGRHCCH